MKRFTQIIIQGLALIAQGAAATALPSASGRIGAALAIGAVQAGAGLIAHHFTPKGAPIPAGQ